MNFLLILFCPASLKHVAQINPFELYVFLQGLRYTSGKPLMVARKYNG